MRKCAVRATVVSSTNCWRGSFCALSPHFLRTFSALSPCCVFPAVVPRPGVVGAVGVVSGVHGAVSWSGVGLCRCWLHHFQRFSHCWVTDGATARLFKPYVTTHLGLKAINRVENEIAEFREDVPVKPSLIDGAYASRASRHSHRTRFSILAEMVPRLW